jgi:hypothetical protein
MDDEVWRAWLAAEGGNPEKLRVITALVWAAGLAAGRSQAATDVRQAVEWYPEDVFPADSEDRSAIAGTAMRHAYEQAAQIAESGHRD